MNISLRKPLISALAVTLAFAGSALAADGANKDEAVTMVKKAVAFIKEQGAEKAYPEIKGHLFYKYCIWGNTDIG